MYINSINLRNIYSFGDEGTPELKDFKTFNLFIGKNGSGKTNVFRVLSDLKLNHDNSIHFDIPNRNINGVTRKPTNKSIQIITDNGNILSDDTLYFQANYDMLKDNLKYIKISVDKKSEKGEIREGEELLDALKKLDIEKRELLNKAFLYIFDRWVTFHNEDIFEVFTRDQDKLSGSNITREDNFVLGWSSGYIVVVSLLLEFFLNYDKNIILMDEPEVHLEPRILRKLLNFLFWLNLSTKQDLSQSEELFTTTVYSKLFSKRVENSEFIKWKKLVLPPTPKQLFISSHSPVLINEFLRYSDFAAIYEFDSQYMLVEGYEILVSVARKVQDSAPHSILDNLGATGADLLQTNGVIWVEGPSDIIYIRKWLDMYAAENSLPKFEQGIHYEFQMFGGTLLDSICYDKEEDNELHKLVSMFSFSRNAFVVIDSDAIMGENRRIKYKSKFEPAKKFISKQFNELSKEGYKLGLWYENDNTKIQTLEDYLDKETKKACGKVGTPTKKKYAQRVVKHWEKEKKLLSEINPKLKTKIENLYQIIKTWND